MEFLDELEKKALKEYLEKKNKVYDIINRRRKQWDENEELRKSLFSGIDETKTLCEFYKEEPFKSY